MAVSRFPTFLDTFDPDPKTRGTHWEHVCKWSLETDHVYRTQHCLFGGVPSKRSVTDESCTIKPSGSGTSTLVRPA